MNTDPVLLSDIVKHYLSPETISVPPFYFGVQMVTDTRLPISTECREEHLRPNLRGGETWDALLRKMAEQYDPEAAAIGGVEVATGDN